MKEKLRKYLSLVDKHSKILRKSDSKNKYFDNSDELDEVIERSSSLMEQVLKFKQPKKRFGIFSSSEGEMTDSEILENIENLKLVQIEFEEQLEIFETRLESLNSVILESIEIEKELDGCMQEALDTLDEIKEEYRKAMEAKEMIEVQRYALEIKKYQSLITNIQGSKTIHETNRFQLDVQINSWKVIAENISNMSERLSVFIRMARRKLIDLPSSIKTNIAISKASKAVDGFIESSKKKPEKAAVDEEIKNIKDVTEKIKNYKKLVEESQEKIKKSSDENN